MFFFAFILSFITDRYVRKDTQEAILRPLQIFQSSLQAGTSNSVLSEDVDLYGEDYNPNLEPTLDDNPIEYYLNNDKTVEENPEKGNNSGYFRKCSFKFITQPLSFQEDLDNIYRSKAMMKIPQEDNDEGNIETSDIDIFDSPRKKTKLSKDGSFSLLSSAKDSKELPVEKQEKLSQLLHKLSRIEENSNKTTAKANRGKKFYDLTFQSKSFQWLIEICSGILYCTPEKLNRKVIELQNCLFTDWNPSKISSRKRLIAIHKK